MRSGSVFGTYMAVYNVPGICGQTVVNLGRTLKVCKDFCRPFSAGGKVKTGKGMSVTIGQSHIAKVKKAHTFAQLFAILALCVYFVAILF
jgi:hypothetical protein